MKIRIALAAALGILIIGVFAWPMAAARDPLGMVSLPTLPSLFLLLLLAFLTGFGAFFVSWPYGDKIGVLAVPAGLTIWAMRSGNIGTFLQQSISTQADKQLFTSLWYQSAEWFLIVAAGFAGVTAAQLAAKRSTDIKANSICSFEPKKKVLLSSLISVLAVLLITKFLITFLAQGIHLLDSRFGSVVSQPANAQIAFAVFVAFMAAGALVKYFLDASFVIVSFAAVFLPFYLTYNIAKDQTLGYMAVNYPANFFPASTAAILPLQIVSIGTIGAVAGYWVAVNYSNWKNQES
ncbi:MAG: hypothetical protein ISS77_00095 [Phycisphaerae bacterium]|nr:hypothetical protein [Phycisphaerae bacterium]